MKYDLGIIGGLGPFASSYLYELITKKTKASIDQEHLNIVILSHSSIPDRTKYILNNSKENPYPYLLNDCMILEKLKVKLISIPCNTSCYFHQELQKNTNVKISNLVENTVKYIKEKGYKKVCILATTGTIKSKLYQNELDKYSINYVYPDQNLVMNLIYDYIKKGKEISKELLDNITKDINADAFILGCTELSIIKGKLKLNDKYIDPLEIETENILKYFKKG